MRVSLACLIWFASSGCSSLRLVKADPPPVAALGQPPAGWAQVCVLRPHWVAWGMTLAVRDNGNLVGATKGNTYFCYFAAPGWHDVATREDDPGPWRDVKSLLVAVLPGQRLYLHHHIYPFGIFSVEWLDPTTAAELLGACGYRILAGGADPREPQRPPVPIAPGTPSPPR